MASSIQQVRNNFVSDGYLADDDASSDEESSVKIQKVVIQSIFKKFPIPDNPFTRAKMLYLKEKAARKKEDRDFWNLGISLNAAQINSPKRVAMKLSSESQSS